MCDSYFCFVRFFYSALLHSIQSFLKILGLKCKFSSKFELSSAVKLIYTTISVELNDLYFSIINALINYRERKKRIVIAILMNISDARNTEVEFRFDDFLKR